MPTRSANSVDLATAAQELAVHYQTAYRWVRTGVLAASVERGRYRIDRDALSALRQGPPRARPSRSNHPVAGRAAVSLVTALVAGDEPAARALAKRVVSMTSVTTLLDEVIAPALRDIGDRWHHGTLTVCTEHRASEIVGRFIGDLAVPRRGRPRGTAVVVTPEGDRHGLPAEMAAAALRDDGWRVEHLGSDVPVDELVDFCTTHDVDLVVISATFSDALATAGSARARLRRRGLRVLVGGPGETLATLIQSARRRDEETP
jgi:excisionase family DNA binding protein